MLLENKYYRLINCYANGESVVFHLALLPDCDVYRGHFPGHPVCPGVCGIEMIKECAMMQTGQTLRISTIHKCRFTAVASPVQLQELMVSLTMVAVHDGYKVEARISDTEKLYVEYKGELLAV